MSPSVTFEFCPKQLWVDAKRAAVAVLVFAGVVGVANCGSGCLPVDYPKDSLEEQYIEDIAACSRDAGTKDDARRCRQDVNRRYGLCDAPWPQLTPCDE